MYGKIYYIVLSGPTSRRVTRRVCETRAVSGQKAMARVAGAVSAQKATARLMWAHCIHYFI